MMRSPKLILFFTNKKKWHAACYLTTSTAVAHGQKKHSDSAETSCQFKKEENMNPREMEMTMENSNSNKMSVSEVLFGSIMATTSIYAAWCAASLLILILS